MDRWRRRESFDENAFDKEREEQERSREEETEEEKPVGKKKKGKETETEEEVDERARGIRFKKRKKFGLLHFFFVILVLIFFVGIPFLLIRVAAPPQDFFPLTPGNVWTYRELERGNEMVIRVARMSKYGKKKLFMVEKSDYHGLVYMIDYYDRSPGNIWLIRRDYPQNGTSSIFAPARILLHNPLKDGDSWNWKGKASDGTDIIEKSEVESIEYLEVPGGKYNAAKVKVETMQGMAKTLSYYWYAPEVGIVKFQNISRYHNSTLVLTDFKLKEEKK